MFKRTKRGFSLIKQAGAILREDKKLILFPVLSGVMAFLVLISFAIPVIAVCCIAGAENTSSFYSYISGETNGSGGSYARYALYLFGVFVFYFINYFIIIFANTGLIHLALLKFKGKDGSFSDGVKYAKSRLKTIISWAFISATIGVVLQTLGERLPLIGKIVVSLTGFVWSIATYLVIPVMVNEKTGAFDSIRRSGALFKKNWGENLVGQFSISTIFVLIGVLACVFPFLGAILFGVIGTLIGVAITIMCWISLSLIASAIEGIFTAALYVFATEGVVPSGFDRDAIENAWKVK